MSQPKRYEPSGIGYGGVEMCQRENGEWVSHADYAALAAENERLRKAGDAMAEVCREHWENALCGSLDDYLENKPHKLPYTYTLCAAWLAAKEGGDAK